MKRFYKEVSIEESNDGYIIKLDDAEVKTPLKNSLSTPSRKLADAIAKEWEAQDSDLEMSIMPLTQMLNTQIDKVDKGRKTIEKQVLEYAKSDMVCYYAKEPKDLVERQKGIWGSLLSDWFNEKYGVKLRVTSGISHIEQSSQDLEKLRGIIEALSLESLTVLQLVVPISGSIVIGLAFMNDHLSADEVIQAAFLDEIYQAEKWGEDDDIVKKRFSVRDELCIFRDFLDLSS